MMNEWLAPSEIRLKRAEPRVAERLRVQQARATTRVVNQVEPMRATR